MIEGGRSHFTPEFILSGLLEQEDSVLAEVIEAAATADDPISRLKAAVAEAIRKLPVPEQPLSEGTSITFGFTLVCTASRMSRPARSIAVAFCHVSSMLALEAAIIALITRRRSPPASTCVSISA